MEHVWFWFFSTGNCILFLVVWFENVFMLKWMCVWSDLERIFIYTCECIFPNESRNEQTSFKATSKPLMSLSGSAILELCLLNWGITHKSYFPIQLSLLKNLPQHKHSGSWKWGVGLGRLPVCSVLCPIKMPSSWHLGIMSWLNKKQTTHCEQCIHTTVLVSLIEVI